MRVSISKLTVSQLRQELLKRGLEKNGIKATLIDRLKKALVNEGVDPDNYDLDDNQSEGSGGELTTSSETSQNLPTNGDGDSEKQIKMEASESSASFVNLLDDNEVMTPMPPPDRTMELTVEDTLAMKAVNDDSFSLPPKINENLTSSSNTIPLDGSMIVNLDDNSIQEMERDIATEKIVEEGEDEEIVDDEVGEAEEEVDEELSYSEKDSSMQDTSRNMNEELQNLNKQTTKMEELSESVTNFQESTIQKRKTNDGGVKKSVKGQEDKVVWVGNIGDNIKAVDLKTLFQQYGIVSIARIVTICDRKNDNKIKKNICYGYLEMSSQGDVLECIKELDGVTFKGQILVVSNIFSSVKQRMINLQKSIKTIIITESRKQNSIDSKDSKQRSSSPQQDSRKPYHQDYEKPRTIVLSKDSEEVNEKSSPRHHHHHSVEEEKESFNNVVKSHHDHTERKRHYRNYSEEGVKDDESRERHSMKRSRETNANRRRSESRGSDHQKIKINAQQKRLEFLERELSRQKSRLAHKEALLKRLKTARESRSTHKTSRTSELTSKNSVIKSSRPLVTPTPRIPNYKMVSNYIRSRDAPQDNHKSSADQARYHHEQYHHPRDSIDYRKSSSSSRRERESHEFKIPPSIDRSSYRPISTIDKPVIRSSNYDAIRSSGVVSSSSAKYHHDRSHDYSMDNKSSGYRNESYTRRSDPPPITSSVSSRYVTYSPNSSSQSANKYHPNEYHSKAALQQQQHSHQQYPSTRSSYEPHHHESLSSSSSRYDQRRYESEKYRESDRDRHGDNRGYHSNVYTTSSSHANINVNSVPRNPFTTSKVSRHESTSERRYSDDDDKYRKYDKYRQQPQQQQYIYR